MITNSGRKKIKVNDLLFYLCFIVYLFITIFNVSFYGIYLSERFLKLIMFVVSGLLILREVMMLKLRIKEIFYLIFCILLTFIILISSSAGTEMIPFFLFLYSARNIPFKKIAKVALIESIMMFIFVILSSKLGIITNYISYDGERVRQYLGFRYALYPSALLFNIVALSLYLTKRKHIFIYLFWFIINYIIYKYTDSRLSYWLTNFLLVSIFILKRHPKILKNRKIINYFMIISFIFSAFVSIYLSYNYSLSTRWMNNLNQTLGGRLYYGHKAIQDYGIHLTGSKVVYIGNGLNKTGQKTLGTYNYVDSLYLSLTQKYGLIFICMFILLLTYAMIKVYKNKNYTLLVILTFIALHGIIDDLILYIYYNTFWFTIGGYIINKKGVINYEEK